MGPHVVGLSEGRDRLGERLRHQLRMEPLEVLLNAKQSLDRNIFKRDSDYRDFDLETLMRNSGDCYIKI